MGKVTLDLSMSHLAGMASFQLSPVNTAFTNPPNRDVAGVEADMVLDMS